METIAFEKTSLDSSGTCDDCGIHCPNLISLYKHRLQHFNSLTQKYDQPPEEDDFVWSGVQPVKESLLSPEDLLQLDNESELRNPVERESIVFGNIPCPHCEMLFPCEWYVRKHIWLVHKSLANNSNKPFECDYCGIFFMKSNYLHTKKSCPYFNTFGCENCGGLYKFQSYLRSHLQKCRKERKPHCNICANSVPTIADALHQIIQGAKPNEENDVFGDTGAVDRKYSCKFCNQSFPAYQSLLNHRRKVYPFCACITCNKRLGTVAEYRDHYRIVHEGSMPKKIKPPETGTTEMVSDDEIKLSKFAGTHKTYEKFPMKKAIVASANNFSCDVCREKFSRKQDVIRHKKANIVYSCKICLKVISGAEDPFDHFANHGIVKMPTRRNKFKIHTKTMHNDAPQTINQNEENLQDDMKESQDDMQAHHYTCLDCNKTFQFNENFEDHLFNTHVQKRVLCLRSYFGHTKGNDVKLENENLMMS